MDIENEASLKAAFRDGLNLFVGAGFSVLASNADSQPMPLGFQLAKELRTQFQEDENEELSLSQLSTVIAASDSQGLQDFLVKRCTVADFDHRYRDLLNTNIQSIFTTNIDDLVHRVYEGSKKRYLHDVNLAGFSADDPDAVDYIALHGSVRDPNRPFKFGTLDIARAYEVDRDRWTVFRERIRKYPTLFLGYGLSDTGTIQAMASDEAGKRIYGDCWIQVRQTESKSAIIRYLQTLGMQVVVADTEDLLEYAKATLSTMAPLKGTPRSRKDRGDIPLAQDVPQRPITDFYLGAAPTWSDIYSGFLVKTTHLRELREGANSGNPTVITGIPGCGKTTLLMQAAVDMPFEGMRFLENDLNVERAKLLARRISGRKALVLIDDVVNDIDVIKTLSRSSNITVVAADRDYRLATATHLLPTNCAIVRVSDQSDQDLQLIWEAIPLQIRGGRLTRPKVSEGVSASLLEFIETNVKAPSLRERIAEAITSLTANDRETAELLVLTCYVHSCRTPISMDTILGFMGLSFESYFELRDKMVSVGEMLHEYTGDLADEPQDYFTARSVILSEAVLREVPRDLLRTVLTRFHRNVSPVRIASFDIFKRFAFDHYVFGRAFRSTDEGTSLYDWLISRDGNEYIRQQQALFLADRGKFKDAFRAIDQARARIGRFPNWSIENSYFKILFSSNLPQHESEEALEQLERALQGLVSCFNKDKRKGMHALVHADCALKYSRVLRTPLAVSHLATAMQQLAVAVESSPWLERPPELLKVVRGSKRKLERELA